MWLLCLFSLLQKTIIFKLLEILIDSDYETITSEKILTWYWYRFGIGWDLQQ